MKGRVATTLLSASVGLIVMLGAVGGVLITTLAVAEIANPVFHAISVAVELALGIGLLVGSVFFATRFTVWLTGKSLDS